MTVRVRTIKPPSKNHDVITPIECSLKLLFIRLKSKRVYNASNVSMLSAYAVERSNVLPGFPRFSCVPCFDPLAQNKKLVSRYEFRRRSPLTLSFRGYENFRALRRLTFQSIFLSLRATFSSGLPPVLGHNPSFRQIPSSRSQIPGGVTYSTLSREIFPICPGR
jgi:hypothetical protein